MNGKKAAGLFGLSCAFIFLWLMLAAIGCGDDDDPSTSSGQDDDDDDDSDEDSPPVEGDFACVEDRANWEQCADDMIQWCHVIEGMDPHFHWGMDCASSGYSCVELTASQAVCVDMSSSCDEGAFKCEDNTAYNCVDGHWGIESCGSKECAEESAAAICQIP